MGDAGRERDTAVTIYIDFDAIPPPARSPTNGNSTTPRSTKELRRGKIYDCNDRPDQHAGLHPIQRARAARPGPAHGERQRARLDVGTRRPPPRTSTQRHALHRQHGDGFASPGDELLYDRRRQPQPRPTAERDPARPRSGRHDLRPEQHDLHQRLERELGHRRRRCQHAIPADSASKP